jgi:hypothetical protein
VVANEVFIFSPCGFTDLVVSLVSFWMSL